MTNLYYTFTPSFTPGSKVRSDAVNTQFSAIQTAFDNLPAGTSYITRGIATFATEAQGATVNDFVCTMPNTRLTNQEGDEVNFRAAHSNTSAATLKIDGISAVSMVAYDGTALTAGDVVAGRYYTFRFDNANTRFIMTASNDAANQVTFASEWAKYPEDSLIPPAAGGNGTTDYSAYHWAQKASVFAGSVGVDNLYLAGSYNASLAVPPSTPASRAVYRISTAGTFSGLDFGVGDWAYYDGASWRRQGSLSANASETINVPWTHIDALSISGDDVPLTFENTPLSSTVAFTLSAADIFGVTGTGLAERFEFSGFIGGVDIYGAGTTVFNLYDTSLRIHGATEANYADFAHDSTNLNTTFQNTVEWVISDLSTLRLGSQAAFVVEGGVLEVQGTVSSDAAQFEHNGTNFVTSFTNTTLWHVKLPMLIGDDGAGALSTPVYVQGTGTAATARFQTLTAAATADIGIESTSALVLRNNEPSGVFHLYGTDSGAVTREMVGADPNGGTALMYVGTTELYTQSETLCGVVINNTLTGNGYERALTLSDAITVGVRANVSKVNNAKTAELDLQVQLQPNTLYSVTGFIEVEVPTASTNPDFSFAFVFSSANQSGGYFYTDVLGGSGVMNFNVYSTDTASHTVQANGSVTVIEIRGNFRTNSSVGPQVDFTWAQGTTDGANATRLRRGSWLHYASRGRAV